MNKKILIHSIVFSPDRVSTAYIYNDIALRLQDSGYHVSVLTTTPHYNFDSRNNKQFFRKKAFGLYYESDFKGIKVKHVYQKKHMNTVLRLLGFIYWHFVSLFLGLFQKKIDLILSPSPPLSIGLINVIIGKLRRTKLVYNVQEIYPDILIESGIVKSHSAIYFLKWIEKLVYNQSDAVITIDQLFYDKILPRFDNKSKLSIIPNFVDTDIYKPFTKDFIYLNELFFTQSESLKLMYAGNIGHAQDWKTLIQLALELKNEPIDFFVIGDGLCREFLDSEKVAMKLEKLHIFPYQPREKMPSLIAYSDLQFIFMSPKTEEHGFPSKVYTIMACAKPLLVCSGEKTPIVNFLKDKNCAYIVTEREIKRKVQEMANLIRNLTRYELSVKGQNGHGYIESTYSKDIVTKQYIDLVDKLLI